MAVTATIALAAASCGGGGAPSKEEFIAQADAICNTYNVRFACDVLHTYPEGDPTSLTSDDDVRAFADPFSATYDVYFQEFEELGALAPPADFREQYDALLASLDLTLQAIAQGAEAARNADREGISDAMQKERASSSEVSRIAKEYGFEVCGQD